MSKHEREKSTEERSPKKGKQAADVENHFKRGADIQARVEGLFDEVFWVVVVGNHRVTCLSHKMNEATIFKKDKLDKLLKENKRSDYKYPKLEINSTDQRHTHFTFNLPISHNDHSWPRKDVSYYFVFRDDSLWMRTNPIKISAGARSTLYVPTLALSVPEDEIMRVFTEISEIKPERIHPTHGQSDTMLKIHCKYKKFNPSNYLNSYTISFVAYNGTQTAQADFVKIDETESVIVVDIPHNHEGVEAHVYVQPKCTENIIVHDHDLLFTYTGNPAATQIPLPSHIGTPEKEKGAGIFSESSSSYDVFLTDVESPIWPSSPMRDLLELAVPCSLLNEFIHHVLRELQNSVGTDASAKEKETNAIVSAASLLHQKRDCFNWSVATIFASHEKCPTFLLEIFFQVCDYNPYELDIYGKSCIDWMRQNGLSDRIHYTLPWRNRERVPEDIIRQIFSFINAAELSSESVYMLSGHFNLSNLFEHYHSHGKDLRPELFLNPRMNVTGYVSKQELDKVVPKMPVSATTRKFDITTDALPLAITSSDSWTICAYEDESETPNTTNRELQASYLEFVSKFPTAKVFMHTMMNHASTSKEIANANTSTDKFGYKVTYQIGHNQGEDGTVPRKDTCLSSLATLSKLKKLDTLEVAWCDMHKKDLLEHINSRDDKFSLDLCTTLDPERNEEIIEWCNDIRSGIKKTLSFESTDVNSLYFYFKESIEQIWFQDFINDVSFRGKSVLFDVKDDTVNINAISTLIGFLKQINVKGTMAMHIDYDINRPEDERCFKIEEQYQEIKDIYNQVVPTLLEKLKETKEKHQVGMDIMYSHFDPDDSTTVDVYCSF